MNASTMTNKAMLLLLIATAFLGCDPKKKKADNVGPSSASDEAVAEGELGAGVVDSGGEGRSADASSSSAIGSALTFDWPSLATITIPNTKGARAAYAKYAELVEQQRPRLATDESYYCSGDNPDHNLFSTGTFKRSLNHELSYDSSSRVDVGFGPGIMPSKLAVAYVIKSPEGERVLIKVGGVTRAMLPLAGYVGQFPYWPVRSSARAKKEGDLLVVQSSFFNWSVYQLAKEDTYFLVATKQPSRIWAYSYGENGLERISSNNRCDSEQTFSYQNGVLDSIETRGAVRGSRTEYLYDGEGRLSSFRTNLINTPKVGEIPIESDIEITWNNGGQVATIRDKLNNKALVGYAYRAGLVSKMLVPSETTEFTYNVSSTTVRSSKAEIETHFELDACRVKARKLAGASMNEKVLRALRTAVVDLDITRVISSKLKGGGEVRNTFSDDHRLMQSVVLDKNGTEFSKTIYSYDALGYLEATSVFDANGELKTTFGYDRGQLVKKLSPLQDVSMVLDDEGNVIGLRSPQRAINYEYDDQGLVTKRSELLTKSNVSFEYNDSCQLTSRSDAYSKKTFEYYPDGRLQSVEQGGAITSSESYDYDDAKGFSALTSNFDRKTLRVERDFWGNVMQQDVNGTVVFKSVP